MHLNAFDWKSMTKGMFLGIHGCIRGKLPVFDTFKWPILHFLKANDIEICWQVHILMLHIIIKEAQAFLIENLWLSVCF